MPTVEAFTYASGVAPESYACKECGTKGVRMYRMHGSSNTELLCTTCTIKSQGEKLAQKGHSCGGRIAAVPTEDGQDWWAFTAVPDEGVVWWDGLPVIAGLTLSFYRDTGLIQGEGTLDGKDVYFRCRHDLWLLSVAKEGDELADDTWLYEEKHPNACQAENHQLWGRVCKAVALYRGR